ncbi:MAG: hypothetical protein KDJ80_07735 [Nitratireductor sp.]|nr:hypothetical protein [Nitratireductor sp.]
MKRLIATTLIALTVASPVLAQDVAGIPLGVNVPAVGTATKQVSAYAAPASFRGEQATVSARDGGRPAVFKLRHAQPSLSGFTGISGSVAVQNAGPDGGIPAVLR